MFDLWVCVEIAVPPAVHVRSANAVARSTLDTVRGFTTVDDSEQTSHGDGGQDPPRSG